MSVKYDIYCATNTINGMKYIGQSNNFRKRKLAHKYYAEKGGGPCHHFYNAIRKYGFGAFEWKVLETYNAIDEADIAEQHYILLWNTLSPNGYNLTTGGKKHNKISDEMKKRQRSEAHRLALIKANTGNPRVSHPGESNPFYGKKHTNESRKIMQEKARGENSVNAKLTWENVYDIRHNLINGLATEKEMSVKYSISLCNIYSIKLNKAWIDTNYQPPKSQSRKILSKEEIEKIFNLAELGYTIPELMKLFQCCRSSIVKAKYKRFKS